MLRREWQVFERGIYAEDFPPSDRECGWSFRWLCTYCGNVIAEVNCYRAGQVQPYRFISSCCETCGKIEGHRFNVPGSLERFELIHWAIPKPILDYQLSVELAFLDHPQHPYNKVSSE